MGAQEPVTGGVVATNDDGGGIPSTGGRGRRRIVVFGAWIVVLVAYQAWAARSGVGPRESTLRLVGFLQGGVWGPLVFVAVYLARLLIMLSAALLTIAAGFLYGPVGGIALVVVAANASAMAAYMIGRWFAPPGLAAQIRRGRVDRHMHRLRAHGFETTLTLRLLFVPYDLVSYAAGFARIHPGAFLAATAIGSVPGTVAFVLFGASLDRLDGAAPEVDWRMVAASVGLLVLSLLGVWLLRRHGGARDQHD